MPTPKWYELDRLLPYREPIAVLGLLLIAAGVAKLSVAAGMIVAGVELVLLGWFMAKGA